MTRPVDTTTLGRTLTVALGLTVALTSSACGRTPPLGEGMRCSDTSPCAQSLRCSFKKKRCYRPVPCDALAKRLDTCARELLEAFSPKAKELPSAERVRRIGTIREKLRSQVVDHCRYDAATHKREKGTDPSDEKSWGEDPNADALIRCIAKSSCSDFATCFLTVANRLGPGAPRPSGPAILPVDLPRPSPDGEAPATPQDTSPRAQVPAGRDQPPEKRPKGEPSETPRNLPSRPAK